MVTTMTRRAAQTPLAQQITRMDTGRLRAYRENLEFYQGRQWADPTRRRERRLTLNYAKAVIEKTASYTMSGLSVVVDPEDGSAEAAARARRAERALREIQETNNLEQRSEEHTSELQSPFNLVWRLLLAKKKNRQRPHALAGNG